MIWVGLHQRHRKTDR